MKARVKWVEDRTFVGETESGHKMVFGTASGADGAKPKPGPSPMELVLIGAGGCSAYDVVILERAARQSRLRGRDGCGRAETDPKVFIRIHMPSSSGARVAEPRSSAHHFSIEKYCSATAMLSKTATVTHDLRWSIAA